MLRVCMKTAFWYKLCLCSGSLALRAFNRGIASADQPDILLFITMQPCLRNRETMQAVIKMELPIINKRSHLADKDGEIAIQIGKMSACLQKFQKSEENPE